MRLDKIDDSGCQSFIFLGFFFRKSWFLLDWEFRLRRLTQNSCWNYNVSFLAFESLLCRRNILQWAHSEFVLDMVESSLQYPVIFSLFLYSLHSLIILFDRWRRTLIYDSIKKTAWWKQRIRITYYLSISELKRKEYGTVKSIGRQGECGVVLIWLLLIANMLPGMTKWLDHSTLFERVVLWSFRPPNLRPDRLCQVSCSALSPVSFIEAM